MAGIDLLATTSLPQRAFYARSTVDVARDLLGCFLLHRVTGEDSLVTGRIVETEAYPGEGDEAAHSCAGITPRTRVIFGPPGHAYVYRVYGMHCCLNVIAEPGGTPGCVLIRALEPICGIDRMKLRRPAARNTPDLANGPGKLTAAMGIGMDRYGADLLDGPLTIRRPNAPDRFAIRSSRRIGISKAIDLELRFFVADNACVSRP